MRATAAVKSESEVGTSNRLWLMWAAAAAFYMFQFVLRVSPNVMMEDLMADFAIDAATVGGVAAFYYYAYSALQIPVGAILDRFGPRRTLFIATLLCGSGGLMFSMAEALPLVKFGRLLIGAGSAFAFAGTMKTATMWFNSSKLPIITGLTVTLGTLGGIGAGYPLAFLIKITGWREALGMFSVAGIALAAFIWVTLRDKHHATATDTPSTWGDIWTGLKKILHQPAMWGLALYGACMYVPLSAFADAWGASYLSKRLSIDIAEAGAISSVIYIGMAIGGLVSGAITNYLGSHKLTMLGSAIGTAVVFWGVTLIPGLSATAITVLLFLAGLFCSGHFMSFVSACALTPASSNATAVGFVNMITMASGVIFQPLIGWLLDSQWNGAMDGNIRLYTLEDYQIAVTAIPASLTLGLILALMLKATGSRYQR